MVRSRSLLVRLSVAAAVAAVLLLAAAGIAPADAASHGMLSTCDMTPVVAQGWTWHNGCYGKNPYWLVCTADGGLDSHGTMYWAWQSQASDKYTLRTSDEPDAATDVLTYIPGGALNQLHLRSLDINMRVIGLNMYATNGTNPVTGKETQIGTWRVLPATTGGYQVPPACPNAVTHKGADVKPIHSRLWFSAPVGSGTLRFRIMVKEGVQGRGAFWFPENELVLREGPAPAPLPPAGANATVAIGAEQQLPTLGAPGQTCADACTQQRPTTPFCHRQAGVDLKSSAALLSAIGDKMPCTLPILAGCPYEGAAHVITSNVRNTCVYRSQDAAATCPPWVRSASTSSAVTATSLFTTGTTSSADRSSSLYVPDICFTAPAKDTQNVCICTNNRAAQGKNPFVQAAIASAHASVKSKKAMAATISASQSSAAVTRTSGAVSGLVVALLCTLGALSTSRGSASPLLLVLVCVCFVCLLSVPSPVSAHNYMRGLHRASEASVVKPCQAKLGPDPHVQIVSGQTFEMEFTNGHGSNEGHTRTYFAIIHESDYDELRADNINDIFREYLDAAPTSARRDKQADAAMWERQHRRTTGQQAGDASYWRDPAGVNPSDPIFIAADPVYDEKSHPGSYGANPAVVQTRVHPDIFAKYSIDGSTDRRAVYFNAKYPWLESVDEFINPYNREDTPGIVDFYSHLGDIARFNFPARKGSGNYIAWYTWSGYGDCVDINVLPGSEPVARRYGLPLDEMGSKQYALKVDHCEIRNIPWATTPMRVVDTATQNASKCVQDCISLGWSDCSAIQVSRVKNPAGTVSAVENIPWAPYFFNLTAYQKGVTWPCKGDSVSQRLAAGCKRISADEAAAQGWVGWAGASWYNELVRANENSNLMDLPGLQGEDLVCFGTKPARNQDLQVDEDYYIADDPSDPAWYSTCYLTQTSGGFIGVPPPPTSTKVPWLLDEQCIDCDFHAAANAYSLVQVPFWAVGLQSPAVDQCADCVLRESAPPQGAATHAEQLSALAGLGQDTMFAGYDAEQDRVEYDAAMKATAESNTDSSDSPGVFGLSRAIGVVVLVAIGVGGVLLVVLVFLLIRRYSKRNGALDTLQQYHGGAGRQSNVELQGNPAYAQRL